MAVAHVAQELLATDQAAIEFILDGDVELRTLERDIVAAEAADDGVRMGELHARYAAVGGYDARSRAGRLMHGWDSQRSMKPDRCGHFREVGACA